MDGLAFVLLTLVILVLGFHPPLSLTLTDISDHPHEVSSEATHTLLVESIEIDG